MTIPVPYPFHHAVFSSMLKIYGLQQKSLPLVKCCGYLPPGLVYYSVHVPFIYLCVCVCCLILPWQNLEQKKSYPCPDLFNGEAHRVTDLFWIATHVFAAIFTPVSPSNNTPSLVFIFTSVSWLYLPQLSIVRYVNKNYYTVCMQCHVDAYTCAHH